MARLIKPPGLILPRGYRKPVKPWIDPTHRLSRGLVGYWHLGDEPPVDGAMHDLVSGNALTVANGPLSITGSHHGGQCAFFNNGPLNQNVTAPNGVQTYPFSMSGWFYHNSGVVALGSLSINPTIWDGWYLAANTSTGWSFNAVSNTTFSTGAIGANTRANQFDHVVCVAASATNRTIYVNGVQGTVDSSSSTPARTDHQFRAGSDGTPGNYWQGVMDAVRFYARALTQQDALQLLAEPYAGLTPAPYRIIGPLSTNVNVTLTGQAMTAGQGAITRTASKALTGQAATAGQGSVTTASAVYKGFAFRHTLAGGTGFPGDGPNDAWADIAVNYVASSAGGSGIGWNFNPGGNTGNINSPVNAHYGGFWGNNDSSQFFRFDVPKGPIDVRLMIGDGNNAIRLRYGPGSTAGTDYSDITGSSSISFPQVTDATGTNFSGAAAWETGNTPIRVTNIAGYLQIQKNPAISFNTAIFVSYQIVPTALVDCTFTDETGAAGAPTLFQNQVSGKLVGTIQQSIGGSPVTSLGVFESDGTTPSLYLQIQYINGVPWLAHKAVQMPALSGTYNFKITQTDISGQAIYSNSPHVQSCAWTVTPASTKPYNDGTFNSKLSTGTFLAAKKVRDAFNQTYNPTTRLGEWLGYVSGTFDYSATIYNITALRNQLASYATTAQGVSNKQFLIEIDTDGTSDWTTHAMYLNTGLSFCPENGNICLIRYKASGAKPVLYGGWQSNTYIRGLHIDGITFGIGIAALADPVNGSSVYNAISWNYFADNALHLPILRVTNCDFGLLFNPSYTGGRTAGTIDQSQMLFGVEAQSNGTAMEQLIVKNCRFWGTHDGIGPFGARMLHVSNCDFALGDDDCIFTMCIRNEDAAYFPDFEQYEWFDNCHMRDVCALDGGAHTDYQQQRSLGNGTHPPNGMIYRLWENSSALINFTDPAILRNLMIISDSAPITGCWINNIFAHNAQRGIDGGQGPGISYAEYNTLGPPNTNGSNFSIQAQQIYENYGAKLVVRNNIMGGVIPDGYDGAGGGYQGNVGYSPSNTSGVDPNTVMVGPFSADPIVTNRWAAPLINEAVPTYNIDTYFANMRTVFISKTGADAGYQGPLTLAGLAMTAGQGVLARSVAIALSGQAMTSGQGTLARTVAKVLSGQAATSQIGAVTLSASWAMPGQAMTAAPGAPALSVAKVLSGQAATSQTGAVALAALLAISGQEASTGLGTVTGTGGDFVAAEGEEVILVPLEDRMMFVPVEERTMAVTK